MAKRRRRKRARRARLVFEHLENVSRRALEEYQEIIRTYVKRKHGVYALYRGNRLFYVGLASNLMGRLRSHLRKWHAHLWDNFSVYLTKNDRHVKELETLAIHVALPKGNFAKGKFSKSINLRRQFRSDMNRWWREEKRKLIAPWEKAKGDDNVVERVQEKEPELAKYVCKSFTIRLTHRGKTHRAIVKRNGMILVGNRKYGSLSTAATAVIGGSHNGWDVWKYQQTQGKWVPMQQLRKK